MKAPAWEKVKRLYKGLGSTRPQLNADPTVVKHRWLQCKDHYTHMIGLRKIAEQAQVSIGSLFSPLSMCAVTICLCTLWLVVPLLIVVTACVLSFSGMLSGD